MVTGDVMEILILGASCMVRSSSAETSIVWFEVS